jgi:hypothetical protein
MRRSVTSGMIFCLLVVALLATGGRGSAAAAPIPLTVSQAIAFSVVGRSCGGIQEQSVATGFDATSGFATADVYLQTRCGGSGRGGGYHVTTYSAWITATWDFTGAVVAWSVGSAPASIDPSFSATDASGNQLYEVVNAINVQPSACAVGNTTYCSYRAYLSLAPGFVPQPRVAGISVGDGPASGGTSVTVTGTGFTGATAVGFGATPAAGFTVNGDTSITAIAPASVPGTVDVTVTTAGGTSAPVTADAFSFIGVPTVTGISPDSGPISGGTEVTITGTNLATATVVMFGENAAPFTVDDDTSLTATAPASEAPDAVHVAVTTVGGTTVHTASDRFTYVDVTGPVATVAGVSPSSGPTSGGTTVTITGSGFLDALGVTFGGIPASFVVNDDTSITAISPALAASTVDVAVATSGGSSALGAADAFTYADAPACTGSCVAPIQCGHARIAQTGDLVVASCRPRATGNARATLSGDTFTWGTSGETTIVSVATSSPDQGGCRAGSVEYDVTGVVVGGTSTYTSAGDAVSARLCINARGKVSLVKTTTFGL